MLIRYEGCLGIKTGYTKKSGHCLVSAAERDGVRLIAVTLQDPDDWRDHARLLDYGFFLLESVVLIGSSGLSACIPVVGGVTDRVRYRLEGPVSAVLPRGDHELSTVFEMRRFCYAPVAEGEVLGRVVWYDGGKEIASRPLIAMSDVEIRPKENGFFRWLRQLFAGKR
jgi:D-alanyl-D-alanine carboxypeptidase/D-alanyl-D-alanine carboxypeptidase (penicillin-binding protein 5/6)